MAAKVQHIVFYVLEHICLLLRLTGKNLMMHGYYIEHAILFYLMRFPSCWVGCSLLSYKIN